MGFGALLGAGKSAFYSRHGAATKTFHSRLGALRKSFLGKFGAAGKVLRRYATFHSIRAAV